MIFACSPAATPSSLLPPLSPPPSPPPPPLRDKRSCSSSSISAALLPVAQTIKIKPKRSRSCIKGREGEMEGGRKRGSEKGREGEGGGGRKGGRERMRPRGESEGEPRLAAARSQPPTHTDGLPLPAPRSSPRTRRPRRQTRPWRTCPSAFRDRLFGWSIGREKACKQRKRQEQRTAAAEESRAHQGD